MTGQPSGRSTMRCVALCAVLLLLAGCSFPRIIVMKDPLTPEEHLALGLAYEQKKEYGLAVKEYQAAAKKLKSANLNLANAYFLDNRPEQAEILYRQVIQDDPECADAYNNLAWLYYTQKRNLPEARELVRKAMELNPAGKENYRDTLNKIEEEINKQT